MVLAHVYSTKGAIKTVFVDVDGALEVYKSSFEAGEFLQRAAVIASMKSRFTEVLSSPKLQELDEFALLTLLAKKWVVEESDVLRAISTYLEMHEGLSKTTKTALNNHVHFLGLQPSQLRDLPTQLPDLLASGTVFDILIFIANGSSQIKNMFRYANQWARKNVAPASM